MLRNGKMKKIGKNIMKMKKGVVEVCRALFFLFALLLFVLQLKLSKFLKKR